MLFLYRTKRKNIFDDLRGTFMNLRNHLQCYHNIMHFEKDALYEDHCHPDYEICFVINGEVTLKVEGETYMLTNGMGVIVEPLQYHSVISNKTQTYERLIFEFEKSVVPTEIKEQFEKSAKPYKIFYDRNLLDYAAKLKDLKHANDTLAYHSLYYSYFLQLMYLIALDHPLQSAKSKDYVPVNASVRTIIDYINTNVGGKILLSDLAKATYLSVTAMCQLFKKEMRISIKQYILQKKFIYAQTLIRNGKTALFAAQEIGYSNYNNFYQLYKKLLGHTPSQDKPHN